MRVEQAGSVGQRCAHPALSSARFVPGLDGPALLTWRTNAQRMPRVWGGHMGKEVARHAFTRADRTRYRQKVRRCLDVFALMLDDFQFDADRPTTGLEIELNLVDPEAEPAIDRKSVV